MAVGDMPDGFFRRKRSNYVRVLEGRKKIVEIGFNAGHSALLGLMTQPELVYVGIDIARHAYTRPCAEYLEQQFPDRFRCFFGDSASVFPRIAFEELLDCDLIHIDGGHSLDLFIIDLTHALTLPNPKGVERFILVDDANAKLIAEKIEEWLAAGFMENVTSEFEWYGRGSVILRSRI